MWVHFQYKTMLGKKKFVVRPFVGGVNGISGETSVGNMGSLLRGRNAPKQDYMVLPEQRWIDGIATAPGIVKQFVATATAPPRQIPPRETKASFKIGGKKLRGKSRRDDGDGEHEGPVGTSIEWQMTGRDEVGGLQLQIIPTFEVDKMLAASVKTPSGLVGDAWKYRISKISETADARRYDVLKTPEEEGLGVGSMIYVKDLKDLAPSRPKRLGDLIAEAPTQLKPQDVVELVAVQEKITEWTLDVSLYNKPDINTTITVSTTHITISLRGHNLLTIGRHMQIGEDDAFDEAVAVIGAKLKTEGALFSGSMATNGLQGYTPVHSWSNLLDIGASPTHPPEKARGRELVLVCIRNIPAWFTRNPAGDETRCNDKRTD